jgi:predicted MFS family arabinose efflux permease
MLAAMASQALLVVLSPTIAAIGTEFGAPVSTVGQARAVSAVAAIAASLAISTRIGAAGVRRLLVIGAFAALGACAVVASAPNLTVFLAGHVLVGTASACLLTAGFGGVAAVPPGRRAWAIGYVAGAGALAWIVVSPLAGLATQLVSWRLAQATPAVVAVAALRMSHLIGPASGARASLPPRILLSDASVRRWVVAELLAYASWTGLLTFVGAFFIQGVGVHEPTAGWLLAAGAAAYFLAATRSANLLAAVPRRLVVTASALGMAVLVPAMLGMQGAGPAPAALAFCLVGLAAGVRTPVSSGLGLDQLPGHREAMMAIRTAVTQLGYLAGAVVGGAVIAAGGYRVLGWVLGAGMAVSAVLMLLVRDPAADRPASPAVSEGMLASSRAT